MKHNLPRVSPHEAGVNAGAVLALLEQWDKLDCEMHSFMLLRHGKVAAEGWWAPYSPAETHMMYSLSKSFTSTAMTFAVREGRLRYEDKVVSFFPEYAADTAAGQVEVRHLLSMCSGRVPKDMQPAGHDLVRDFFTDEFPSEPGGAFAYDTLATYMCSAIISRLTDMTLLDYLRPRLFEPLGIDGISWDICPRGHALGGVGLHLHTEDIAKFGQMLCAGGVFDGQRILFPDEIERMTCRRINNMDGTAFPKLDETHDEPILPELLHSDWAHGYGRQFWRCVPDGVFRGDGMFGQFCVVMPKQDMVLAMTCGADDLQKVLTPVWDTLLPAVDRPSDPADEQALRLRQQSLALSFPHGGRHGAVTGTHTFRLPQEQPRSWGSSASWWKLAAMRVCFDEPQTLTLIHDDGREETLPLYDVWRCNARAAAGGWTTPTIFSCRIVAADTPFSLLLKLDFGGGNSSVTFRPWNGIVTLTKA